MIYAFNKKISYSKAQDLLTGRKTSITMWRKLLEIEELKSQEVMLCHTAFIM